MYIKLLKQSGYKITKSRQLVIDYFKNNKHPISATVIYQGLGKKMDKVTVYRILETLKKVGIVFEEYNGKENLYYLAKKQHHHIICNKCGRIECMPCKHFFKGIKNFKNINHNLSLSGLCNKCGN